MRSENVRVWRWGLWQGLWGGTGLTVGCSAHFSNRLHRFVICPPASVLLLFCLGEKTMLWFAI